MANRADTLTTDTPFLYFYGLLGARKTTQLDGEGTIVGIERSPKGNIWVSVSDGKTNESHLITPQGYAGLVGSVTHRVVRFDQVPINETRGETVRNFVKQLIEVPGE